MDDTNRNIVHIPNSRCAVCSHSDRADLDRALALRTRTQSEVAEIVGVARSSVSRHVKNHLQPQLAAEILLGDELSVLDVVTELNRLYGRRQLALERATATGDTRLERDLLDSQQRLLFEVVKAAGKLGEGGLRHLEKMQSESMTDRADDMRAEIHERLVRSEKQTPLLYKLLTGDQGPNMLAGFAKTGTTVNEVLGYASGYRSFEDFIERYPQQQAEVLGADEAPEDAEDEDEDGGE